MSELIHCLKPEGEDLESFIATEIIFTRKSGGFKRREKINFKRLSLNKRFSDPCRVDAISFAQCIIKTITKSFAESLTKISWLRKRQETSWTVNKIRESNDLGGLQRGKWKIVNSPVFETRRLAHIVKITEIFSHTFLTKKNSWKQLFYKKKS